LITSRQLESISPSNNLLHESVDHLEVQTHLVLIYCMCIDPAPVIEGPRCGEDVLAFWDASFLPNLPMPSASVIVDFFDPGILKLGGIVCLQCLVVVQGIRVQQAGGSRPTGWWQMQLGPQLPSGSRSLPPHLSHQR
jgi:hypothetical protein